MNLPNKLTLSRVVMIPIFVVFMYLGKIYDNQLYFYIADGIFILASLTDMLDGKIARKYNLITNFGKFMDPLADKLLVCTAMISLVELTRMPAWVCMIIIAREFIISGFRLIASDNGVVIAASYWGKFKTVFQMIFVIIMVADIPFEPLRIVGVVVMYIACALTIISLVDYIVKNRDVIKEK